MKAHGMEDAMSNLAACHLTRYGFTYPENPMKDDLSDRVKACTVEVKRVASIDKSNGRYRVLEIETPKETLIVWITPTGLIRSDKQVRDYGPQEAEARTAADSTG